MLVTSILATAVTLVVIGGVIFVAIKYVINAKALKNIAHHQCPDAWKIIIQEKKQNAVRIGIFDENDNVETMEISSDEGVSNRLHEGQVILLQK